MESLNQHTISKTKEIFVKMLITKEFLHKNFLKIYLKNFISKSWNKVTFNENDFSNKVNDVFNFISENNVTAIRPNNLEVLSDEMIKDILTQNWDEYKIDDAFSKDLITLFEWKDIDLEINYNENTKLTETENRTIESAIIAIIKENYISLLKLNHLNSFSDNIIQEIIEIIKKD